MNDLTQYRSDLIKMITCSDLLQTWPKCHSILYGDDALWSWAVNLSSNACLAAGGSVEDAIPVAAAWLSLNKAAHFIDQAQDTPTPSEPEIGSFSLALIFAAYDFLAAIRPDYSPQVLHVFSNSAFHAVLGQNKGFTLRDGMLVAEALEGYWNATISKSGSLFQMITAGSAAATTNDQTSIDALAGYGMALGTILQILDDCRDILDERGSYEISLPVLLYSLAVGSQTVVLPQAQSRSVLRKTLEESGTLKVISNTLLNCQQRGLDSLAFLVPDKAVDTLKTLLTNTLRQGLTFTQVDT